MNKGLINRSHLSAFISNCKKYNHRLLKGDMKPDITIFMDWTDDELEQLGFLSVRFSSGFYPALQSMRMD